MNKKRLVTLNDKPFSVYLDDLEFQNFCTTNRNAGIEVREEKLWDEKQLLENWTRYQSSEGFAVNKEANRIYPNRFIYFFNDYGMFIADDDRIEFEYIILKRMFIPRMIATDPANATTKEFAYQYLNSDITPSDFNSIAFFLASRLLNIGPWFTEETAEFILAQERATFLNK